jgi:hypothetical protein
MLNASKAAPYIVLHKYEGEHGKDNMTDGTCTDEGYQKFVENFDHRT